MSTNERRKAERHQQLILRAECGLRWIEQHAFDTDWRRRLGNFTGESFHPAFNMGKIATGGTISSPHRHPLVLVYGIAAERYTELRHDEQRQDWRTQLESPGTSRVDDYRRILNAFEVGEERARHFGFLPPLEMDFGWNRLHLAWKQVLKVRLTER